jgi:hypothetical protein
MVALAFSCVPIAGNKIDKFEGQQDATLSFGTGGGTTFTNISVPYFSASKSAVMNITGMPYISGGNEYPTNVKLDVGNDGTSDWEFNGTGYGPLGHQDRIDNKSTSVSIALNNGVSKVVSVDLPKGGVITSAAMTFKGYPTTPSKKNVSKTYLQVNGTKAYSSNVTGLPQGAVDGLNASVGLKSLVGLKNMTDVSQKSSNGFSPTFIYGTSWVGQSFKISSGNPISHLGVLYRVDVFTGVQNNPIDDLYIEIYNTTGVNNFPTGVNLSFTKVKAINVMNIDYTTFIFNNPPILNQNYIYAVVLKSPNSALASGYYRFDHDDSGINNANSKYPTAGCWELFSNSAGISWSKLDPSDIRFITYIKGTTPLVGNDFNNITVNSIPYTSKSGSTLYYNFSNPTYANGKWPFNIKNSNPFDIIFNLSTATYYKEYPLGIQFNVGDDSVVDWSTASGITSTILTTDLAQVFNAALQPFWGTPDAYGNRVIPIPLMINSSGNGTLELSKIDIKYDYAAKVSGFGTDIDTYVKAHGTAGQSVNVPIKVSSTTAGKVLLNGLNYTFDGAPVNTVLMPLSLSVKEDSKKVRLIDLDHYFKDDYDTTLTYSIVNWSPKDVIVLGIDQGHWLTADMANATNGKDWNGDVSIHGIRATDSRDYNVTTGDFVLHVMPVNDPPWMTTSPITTAQVGKGYLYKVNASDKSNEHETLAYSLDVKPHGMTIDAVDGVISWTPAWTDIGLANVTVNVTDGDLFVLQSFQITVTSTNHAPVFKSTPPLLAWVNQVYSYEVQGYDDDAYDVLVYSLDGAHPWGMTMTGTVITWTPGQSQVGKNGFIVHISDGLANVTQHIIITVGTNAPPVFSNDPVLKAKVGKTYYYNVTATDSDHDQLNFSLIEKPPTMTITKDGHITWAPQDADKNFTWTIVVAVTDGKAQVTQRYNITVDPRDIVKPNQTKPNNNWLWALLAVIIIIVIAIIAAVLILGRRKKPKPVEKKDDWPDMQGETEVKERPKPKVVPVAEEAVSGTLIEEVFIIYHDGRLITHQARRLAPDMDSDVVSSMFTAIQNFIKDSFSKGEEGNLKSFEYGDKKILLCHGEKVYLAMVIDGPETPGIRGRMSTTLSEIEYKFGDRLKDWNGRLDELKGINKTLKPLVAMSRAEKEMALESELVNLLGNVDFYKGFIVVKTAVMNGAATVITDAEVKLVYHSDALRLDHVQPDLPLTGSEVKVGNLGPGERKTVAFYLDPVICVKSNIDATVSFKDSKGALRTKGMEQLKAEVVCPILYSDEEINVAMLKRLIGILQVHDSKIFPIPSMIKPKRTLELGKEVLSGFKAKLVREFCEPKPFSAEAWYHGKTKVGNRSVVTRLSVKEASNIVEFFVATDELPALTGLLAELGHEFAKALRTECRSEDVAPITDQSKREKIIKDTKLLIDRYAGSDENECEITPVDQEK